MVIAGSFRGETDDGVYVWLRRLENEAERERLYKAVYESSHWLEALSDRAGACIDRETISVHRLTPTRMSVMR